MRKSAKRAIVIVSTLAVTGVAGAAWASWLANGTGTAAAEAGTAKELVVTSATAGVKLYPGATADSALTVENPNSYPVWITKISLDGGIKASSAACNNTGVYWGDFTMGTQSAGEVLTGSKLSEIAGVDKLMVPANGTATFDLAKTVRMINNSENACQGNTFTIPVKVSGESAA